MYDAETALYYLQTRYYAPEMGRFINADAFVSTGQGFSGNNMIAYCGNEPIGNFDSYGQSWNEILEVAKSTFNEIKIAIGLLTPAYAGCGGAALADGPLPIGDIIGIAGAAMLTAGAIGYGIYQSVKGSANSNSKVEENSDACVIPKSSKNSVVFPTDPNAFNPVGLVKVYRAGTKNGALISWMDPITNTEVFRWDENINYPNGPHYHIYGTGHYSPGMTVPEPLASIYFPTE